MFEAPAALSVIVINALHSKALLTLSITFSFDLMPEVIGEAKALVYNIPQGVKITPIAITFKRVRFSFIWKIYFSNLWTTKYWYKNKLPKFVRLRPQRGEVLQIWVCL